MARIPRITVSAESKPGVQARIGRVVAEVGVTLSGVCAGEAAGRGTIRLAVSDLFRPRKALA